MSGEGDVFDRYPYSNAANARFYERYMNGEKLTPVWGKPSDFEIAPLDRTPSSSSVLTPPHRLFHFAPAHPKLTFSPIIL